MCVYRESFPLEMRAWGMAPKMIEFGDPFVCVELSVVGYYWRIIVPTFWVYSCKIETPFSANIMHCLSWN